MGLGYMSEAWACGQPVLGTSSSLTPSYEKIESSGVRGAGYLQAGFSVFAWDYAKWEGSLTWDLAAQDGSWSAVSDWAVTNRNNKNNLKATPGGGYTTEIKGFNTSFSGNTSANSLVSISAGALGIGDNAGSYNSSGVKYPEQFTSSGSRWCGENSLLPYWMTSASVSGNGGFGNNCCATEWSFQVDNAVVPVFCCKAQSGTHATDPGYLLLGATEASASATFYDCPIPSNMWARDVTLTITLGSVGSISVTGIIESTDLSLQTGDSIVGFGVTVKGVGCGTNGCVRVTG